MSRAYPDRFGFGVERSRFDKAQKISALLKEHSIDAGKASLMTPEEWKSTAICAGFKGLSDATREMVIRFLEIGEKTAAMTEAQLFARVED